MIFNPLTIEEKNTCANRCFEPGQGLERPPGKDEHILTEEFSIINCEFCL